MRHTSHTTRHTAPYDVSYTVIRRFKFTLTTHCKLLTFKWKFTFENLQLSYNAHTILYTLYTLTVYSSTTLSTVYYTSTIVCKPLKLLSFFIILCFQWLIVYSSTDCDQSLGAGVRWVRIRDIMLNGFVVGFQWVSEVWTHKVYYVKLSLHGNCCCISMTYACGVPKGQCVGFRCHKVVSGQKV